ncbi:MAG: hypothetical protein GYA21_11215 [Myxococcales bacterium]|nr:hypothetical protein [Myxococcales bacterium]
MALIAIHAIIHLMGFAKASELVPCAQLKIFISRPMGLVWLAACALLLAAVVLLFAAPRWFWWVGLVGLVVSRSIRGAWHLIGLGLIGTRSVTPWFVV